MNGPRLPGGVVHELPADLRRALLSSPAAIEAWKDITLLARNEFICLVEDAKRAATRELPADTGGARRGQAPAVLLAGLQAPGASRPMSVSGEA